MAATKLRTMKHTVLIICFFLLFSNTTFGQNHNYKTLNDIDQEVINNLCSTFKDTSILISPFIKLPIEYLSSYANELTEKYGFKKGQMVNNHDQETYVLRMNKYFKILPPDSLIKYENIPHDSSDLNGPIVSSIGMYYGKKGICFFHKIIFSQNKTYALVQYWIECGFMCGSGQTVLMKKIKTKWIVIKLLAFDES